MSEKKQIIKKLVDKTRAVAATKAPTRALVQAVAKTDAASAPGKISSGAKIASAAKVSRSAKVSVRTKPSLSAKSIAVTKPGIATRVTANPAPPVSKLAPVVTAPVHKATAPVGKAPAPVGKAPAPAGKVKGENSEAPSLATKKKLAVKHQGRAIRLAKFCVGQVVRHRIYPFRGVVFDIDPVFANTDEWLNAIPPNVRPRRNQPFYHLLAESAETEYIAYVSEQNLLPDESGQPLRHPQITEYFVENDDGTLRAVFLQAH